MKTKISRKYLTLSISIALIIISGIAEARAIEDWLDESFQSFFAPETSRTLKSHAFYYTS